MKKIKITFLIIGFLFSVAITNAQMVGTPYIPADCETPAQPGAITGSASVTAGATGLTYSVADVTGATSYVWSVSGDGWSITAGQNTDQITVTAGSADGTVSVKAHNDCGDSNAQTLNVTTTPAIVIPTTLGAGSLSGRICFDIDATEGGTECGTVASRLPNKADFSDPATYTQTYTFTAAATGTVKNVRYVIQDPDGVLLPTQSLSGTLNAGTMTNGTTAPPLQVQFKTTLNSPSSTPQIVGRTRTQAAKVTINIIYNNNSQDVDVPLTANIQDCVCCGAFVTATQWKEFMCQNLGADQTADPFTPSSAINGDYYQWGSPTPAATRDAIIGTWSSAIPATYYGDNTTATNITTKSPTDPCPSGYRVPSYDEWNGVISNNTKTNLGKWSSNKWSGSMFGDALFLPAAGYSLSNGGSLNNRGISGYYWNSMMGSNGVASNMYFLDSNPLGSSTTMYVSYDRANAFSIRCIAE